MPATPATAVVVSGLVKRYDHRAAVDGWTWWLPPVRSPRCSGPTVPERPPPSSAAKGSDGPDGGTVAVLGMDPVADARALRPRVGVMLQDGGLPGAVPAGEVLRHVAAMYARPRDVAALSERLGLHTFARTQVRRLSGGERQRLALAAAVVGRPDVAFPDEPSAGLDPQSRLVVWDLIRSLRDEGTAIVLTTHQMNEAEALADQVVVVDEGRVIAAGTIPALVGSDGTVRVAVRPTDGAAAPPAPDDVLAARLAAALTAGRRGPCRWRPSPPGCCRCAPPPTRLCCTRSPGGPPGRASWWTSRPVAARSRTSSSISPDGTCDERPRGLDR